jgi:streptogramin lyase
MYANPQTTVRPAPNRAGGRIGSRACRGAGRDALGRAGRAGTQSKAIKGSEPTGITVAPNGDPWFTMMSANKIATFQLR